MDDIKRKLLIGKTEGYVLAEQDNFVVTRKINHRKKTERAYILNTNIPMFAGWAEICYSSTGEKYYRDIYSGGVVDVSRITGTIGTNAYVNGQLVGDP